MRSSPVHWPACPTGIVLPPEEEVAATLQAYADNGVTWVLPVDYMPLMLTPEEAPAALGRSIEVCAHLKGAVVPA